MCMEANRNSKRFALLHLIIHSFFSFLFFSHHQQGTEGTRTIAVLLLPHQQYLDTNGKKRKKHNKQAKTAFFSFLLFVLALQIDCSLN